MGGILQLKNSQSYFKHFVANLVVLQALKRVLRLYTGCFSAFLLLEKRYAEESDDRLHMESFYDNYCNPQTVDGGRNYPVVCVNYHKLWDNKEALVKALGLPAGEALKVI